MKKIQIFLILTILLLMGGCNKMNMNTVVNEPNFAGIVTYADEKSILVKVNEGEEILKSADVMSVSLNVELKDSMTEFNVGDEVRVYYDGTVAESYPGQIHKVYAIVLIAPAK